MTAVQLLVSILKITAYILIIVVMLCLNTRWRHSSFLTFLLCCLIWTLSAIGADGMCCQSREFKEWHGCRSTKGVTKGKTMRTKCHPSHETNGPHSDWFLTLRHLAYFLSRKVLLRGGLPWSGSVSYRMVFQPGCTGSRYRGVPLKTKGTPLGLLVVSVFDFWVWGIKLTPWARCPWLLTDLSAK